MCAGISEQNTNVLKTVFKKRTFPSIFDQKLGKRKNKQHYLKCPGSVGLFLVACNWALYVYVQGFCFQASIAKKDIPPAINLDWMRSVGMVEGGEGSS